MALEIYAIVHAQPVRDRIGRRRGWGPDQPDGYHVTAKAAAEAAERWKKRLTHCRVRVARLVEVELESEETLSAGTKEEG